MQLKRYYQKLLKSFFFPRLHNDLHYMPVALWWRISKESNPNHVIKDKESKWLKLFSKESILEYTSEQYNKLNDDFTDYFGLGAVGAKRLKLMAKIQVFKVNFAVTKSNYWLTQILVAETEIKQMGSNDTVDEYEMLRSVNMALSANIDPNIVSVIQYYSDQRTAVKKSKQ